MFCLRILAELEKFNCAIKEKAFFKKINKIDAVYGGKIQKYEPCLKLFLQGYGMMSLGKNKKSCLIRAYYI